MNVNVHPLSLSVYSQALRSCCCLSLSYFTLFFFANRHGVDPICPFEQRRPIYIQALNERLRREHRSGWGVGEERKEGGSSRSASASGASNNSSGEMMDDCSSSPVFVSTTRTTSLGGNSHEESSIGSSCRKFLSTPACLIPPAAGAGAEAAAAGGVAAGGVASGGVATAAAGRVSCGTDVNKKSNNGDGGGSGTGIENPTKSRKSSSCVGLQLVETRRATNASEPVVNNSTCSQRILQVYTYTSMRYVVLRVATALPFLLLAVDFGHHLTKSWWHVLVAFFARCPIGDQDRFLASCFTYPLLSFFFPSFSFVHLISLI